MSWENNQIRITRGKPEIFLGSFSAVFPNVWFVHVQLVPWVSGDVVLPTSVRLRQN